MPENNFSLLDLKGLSKPACKLIDAVRSAVGLLYEPTHIRRKAKAEADAALILTDADGKSKELALRAAERLKNLELRRQENIEAITCEAIKQLPPTVDEKLVDEDWVVQFFDLCQDVGDEEMRILWSKLLAGEVSRPGSFSPRTMQGIRSLRKEDAQLFAKFCAYLWRTSDLYFYPSTNQSDEFLSNAGLHVLAKNHLRDVGLISSETLTFNFTKDLDILTSYFDRQFAWRDTRSNQSAGGVSISSLGVSLTVLTDIGIELAPISGATPDPAYLTVAIESLKAEDGIELSLVQAAQMDVERT